ncbi:MAG TPA: cytochrome c oxidase subunit II [Acidimicrobiia bacterium]|nr:cytochrome c oxidase subunit II [Acidimicrobiia bacterium]
MVSTGRVDCRRRPAGPLAVAVFAIGAAVATGGCSGEASIVSPKGPAAKTVAGIWWPMLVTATVVFAFVAGMLVLAAIRGRRKTDADAQGSDAWGERFIVITGVVVSGAILIGFFLFTLDKMQALADGGRATKLTVGVVGHDWWWEVRYPNGAVSANEIHIPAGVRVRLELTSDDVIHSFWVPRLGPKMDMIPGQRNHLWLEASEPGVYRGQCTEFCGLQHANMLIRVVADAPADFEAWMAREAEPVSPEAASAPGREVFDTQTCAGCHVIRGTGAAGKGGPDLTHFARRGTLGAGVRPRTPKDVARWISDPQSLKPGAAMPPTILSADQLAALVAYLEELR